MKFTSLHYLYKQSLLYVSGETETFYEIFNLKIEILRFQSTINISHVKCFKSQFIFQPTLKSLSKTVQLISNDSLKPMIEL